jgi:hypothetical protein
MIESHAIAFWVGTVSAALVVGLAIGAGCILFAYKTFAQYLAEHEHPVNERTPAIGFEQMQAEDEE